MKTLCIIGVLLLIGFQIFIIKGAFWPSCCRYANIDPPYHCCDVREKASCRGILTLEAIILLVIVCIKFLP